jgi:hypothetical protein
MPSSQPKTSERGVLRGWGHGFYGFPVASSARSPGCTTQELRISRHLILLCLRPGFSWILLTLEKLSFIRQGI